MVSVQTRAAIQSFSMRFGWFIIIIIILKKSHLKAYLDHE